MPETSEWEDIERQEAERRERMAQLKAQAEEARARREAGEPLSRYWFKVPPEIIRAIALAMLLAFLQAILTADFDTLSEAKTWAIAVGGAVAQAGAAMALALIGSGGVIKK